MELYQQKNPDEGDHHRFFVVGGTEEDLVYTKGNNLYAKESIDYETQPYLDLVIQVTDRGRASEEFPLSIKITNTNDAPTDLHYEGGLVSENLPIGTTVGSLTLEDVDPGAVSPEPDDPNFPVFKIDLESVTNNSLLNAKSLPDMSLVGTSFDWQKIRPSKPGANGLRIVQPIKAGVMSFIIH